MNLNKIHSDVRGDICILTGNLQVYPEVTIFRTKKNYARGGCIHNYSSEFCCVLEGTIRYVIGEKVLCLGAGNSVSIPKATPHYFISITDSVVLEWGATPEEKLVKHKEFREIVDAINKRASEG